MAPISDYTRFMSRRTLRRSPSAIRKLIPLMKIPGMLSLAGGYPNPASFPFKTLNVTMADTTAYTIEGPALNEALQYGISFGTASLVNLIKDKMHNTHKPPYEKADDWAICMGVGSQDLLSKTFDTLADENETVLVENPVYAGALAALAPLGVKLRGVETDGQGIIPEDLARALKEGNKIRFLYTVPTGQNPSGATTTEERRRAVYELARAHDILIVEDDPYYYLYFGEDKQPHSYLSIDQDHRVVRLDSLSKVLSSGMRMGWMTGPTQLVTQVQLDVQASSMHTPTMTQAIVYELLSRWGDSGWDAHIRNVKDFYRNRRDVFIKACDRHLKGLAEYTPPTAGMFVWFKCLGVDDTNEMISKKAVERKVLLVPGAAFYPSFDSSSVASPYVRASFSLVSEEDMDEALARLAAAIRETKEENSKK